MKWTDQDHQPLSLPIDQDMLPAPLKQGQKHVLWRWTWLDDRHEWTKVPHQPNGRNASVTNPDTWVTWEQAWAAYQGGQWSGIGRVLDGTGSLICIDLDDCVSGTGPNAWARSMMERFDTYVEWSPTGTGLHIWVAGEWPNKGQRNGHVEVYKSERYITLSGYRASPEAGITAQPKALELWRLEHFKPRVTATLPSQHIGNDDELIERAREANAGFAALWDGDTGAYGNDDSRADQALANHLVWWTDHDLERTDRLFRRSGLMRDKWDSKRGVSTYGRRTIEEADNAVAGGYEQREQREVTPNLAVLSSHSSLSSKPPWPTIRTEAFYGLAGEVVHAIEPHSEADPAALLIQFLSGFGNLIGRSAYFVVDGAAHYTNLFTVQVGRTARGRKGSSWAQVRRVLESIDRDWVQNNIKSGLSSGEGLIEAVRDQRDTGKKDRGGNEIWLPGVDDKRLFVFESEFSSVLKQATRPENILAAVLRQSWETGSLRTMNVEGRQATDAHITINGHITKEELLRQLTETDAANGFGNRFLWYCAQRSKYLPKGGGIPNFLPLHVRLVAASEFAETAHELEMTTPAWELWESIYRELSDGPLGDLLNAMTSRAEANVRRLSMIYALLDRTLRVDVPHLKAALALWSYCEDSARYIFGERMGDPTADAILTALRQSPDGLGREQIREALGHSTPAGRLNQALGTLAEHGLASMRKVKTGGRDREVWVAKDPLRGKGAMGGNDAK